ncbi:tyrosine-type recombinase/integrase [Mycolicibacterium gilvum]|uniref:Site-specific recombinase XerD n=3 Tax=Mycolicibacterium gilvum TaxID=1804 RepID=E6TAR6_MYCSR|nr:site-specific recombinase XerD [Mycolicibacterium gilvum Spyr1]ADU00731.1 site-specific recombinase XerD [Mycolicibacterium gilvum Spyr1]ADU00737.1 site-specific recombinase XerD [Mycolicibacterium gilvum Spyr1]ADU01159.1 site-specific recombinase XerD [Mycolicibacterium gilvum Spyr1]ADU01921.1 site-specific recombinase XerD [Mycolicibacterium gilvum Spyr1]
MLPEHDYAPTPETPAQIYAAYLVHLQRRDRGNTAYAQAARSFLRRWPRVQSWADIPLDEQLAANCSTRPFVTFLMVSRRLQPGYDYLVHRKLSSLWHELTDSCLQPDLDQFISAALELGFTERVASAIGSQIIARLLIQTGRPLTGLRESDLQELLHACHVRQERTGRGAKHYRSTTHSARQILFHLGILDTQARPAVTALTLEQRMVDVPVALRPAFVAYLNRKYATCVPKTVSSLATRLAHFGRYLAAADPSLTSLNQLDRRRHIEPFITSLTTATNSVTGEPITVADRIRRIHAVGNFLAEITEWGWDDAPPRRLIFRTDLPRPPRCLPRYLPVDSDRKLTAALAKSPYRLAADALLVQRACGLRIGELLDLELDCIHEIPGQGSWLKVPLGKLNSERMIPVNDEVLTLVDRITTTRSSGRPMIHPRTGAPADFLFTHHGKRLSQNAVREELNRAAQAASLGHITPHQLRHTYATALINAGVSLQALMALLGHVSTQMSLRYAHLFDHTVRTEYERALDLAKSHIGALPKTAVGLPITDITGTGWKDTPAIKSRLAGGYCLRAPAQGSCPYANICEHCPSFHTDSTHLAVLAAQRIDAQDLAADAEKRGWIDEAERHHNLVSRLDALITGSASA